MERTSYFRPSKMLNVDSMGSDEPGTLKFDDTNVSDFEIFSKEPEFSATATIVGVDFHLHERSMRRNIWGTGY